MPKLIRVEVNETLLNGQLLMQNNMVIKFFHYLKILHFLGIKSEIYQFVPKFTRTEVRLPGIPSPPNI